METKETDTVRLTPTHLDEIRNSVDWQAMFAGLGFEKAEKKSKPNDLWAFSPFHEEKTASFHMGPGGVWYDFSIGEGGGAIELVQKIQNCNCYEAGKYILEHGWAKPGVILHRPVKPVTRLGTECVGRLRSQRHNHHNLISPRMLRYVRI